MARLSFAVVIVDRGGGSKMKKCDEGDIPSTRHGPGQLRDSWDWGSDEGTIFGSAPATSPTMTPVGPSLSMPTTPNDGGTPVPPPPPEPLEIYKTRCGVKKCQKSVLRQPNRQDSD